MFVFDKPGPWDIVLLWLYAAQRLAFITSHPTGRQSTPHVLSPLSAQVTVLILHGPASWNVITDMKIEGFSFFVFLNILFASLPFILFPSVILLHFYHHRPYSFSVVQEASFIVSAEVRFVCRSCKDCWNESSKKPLDALRLLAHYGTWGSEESEIPTDRITLLSNKYHLVIILSSLHHLPGYVSKSRSRLIHLHISSCEMHLKLMEFLKMCVGWHCRFSRRRIWDGCLFGCCAV